MSRKMTLDEAILCLRKDPRYADLIRDCYVEPDVLACARRFRDSGEFAEVERLLAGRLKEATVLDLGAGTGIASYALAEAGARLVFALEPNPSSELGAGAVRRIAGGLPIKVLAAAGEKIPLESCTIGIVYSRQVLHHASDLKLVLRECARVLEPGGVLLACREPVVDDAEQLRRFLESNVVHQLAGGENAYPLETYLAATREAGLTVERVLKPWDTVINAFPEARTNEELAQMPRTQFCRHCGARWAFLRLIPGLQQLFWRWFSSRRVPGRMYTFSAVKPSSGGGLA